MPIDAKVVLCTNAVKSAAEIATALEGLGKCRLLDSAEHDKQMAADAKLRAMKLEQGKTAAPGSAAVEAITRLAMLRGEGGSKKKRAVAKGLN